MTPTEHQIAMMRHAIGDRGPTDTSEPGWRNHYVTSMGGPDEGEWKELAAAGLAWESTRTVSIIGPTQRCFHVTDAGLGVCAEARAAERKAKGLRRFVVIDGEDESVRYAKSHGAAKYDYALDVSDVGGWTVGEVLRRLRCRLDGGAACST